MSLYNIVNGYNPACVLVLPMLGRKSEEYPRFRDCFISEDNTIVIYTRVGGNNRNSGYGEEKLYEDPNFIKTYDYEHDDTYGYYEFRIPEQWKADYDRITAGNMAAVSDEYIALVKSFYPKLTEAGLVDRIFER